MEKLLDIFPRIKRFCGRVIVVKYGGSIMLDTALKRHVIEDLVFLSHMGLRPVLVHGGGPAINDWLAKLHMKPLFRNGVRMTDAHTMQVVEMVLAGQINKELVSLINVSGGNAVGLSGKDGSLTLVQPINIEAMGFVGEIVDVNTRILSLLIENSYIPVIASISSDEQGQSYNVNADFFASRVAIALNAESLIFLTDMPGILLDVNNISTIIRTLNIGKAHELEKRGVISGGMIPKVHSCIQALEHGVISTRIIDGRVSHSLLSVILARNSVDSTLITL